MNLPKHKEPQKLSSRAPYLPAQDSSALGFAPQPGSAERRLEELSRAVSRQQQQMEGLLHISATLRQSQSPREAMSAIVTQVSQLLEADRTTIYELNDDQTMLQGLAVQGESSVSVGIPNGRGLAGLVASTRKTLNLVDAYDHPSFDVRFDKLTGYRTRSVLCAPMLRVDGEVIGVVQVLNKLNGAHFTAEDVDLLNALAAQAAISLESLKLNNALKSSFEDLKRVSAQAERQLEEQELLYEVERASSNADNIAGIAEGVLLRSAQVIGANLVALFVPNEEGYGAAYLQELHPTRRGIPGAVKLNEAGLYLLPRVDLGEGLLGKVASRGEELILIGDCFELEALPRALSDRCGYEVNNTLATPLLDDRSPIGSLLFVNTVALNGWEPPRRRRGDSFLDFGGATLDIRQMACFEGVPAEVRNRAAKSLRYASLIASQLGRAAAQLSRRRTALQQDRMMTIGQMMSGVMHDMRGPMTSISGYAQLMARAEEPEARAEMAKTIRRKVKELNEMTREILSFAKGERTVLSRKVFLRQFVEHIVEALQAEFDESGVTLQLEGELKGVAYFDEVKMQRVVINIARNARQAMSAQELGRAPRLIWRVGAELDSAGRECLTFELIDNGPGIPEMIRGRVFDAFTTSGKAEGTGLGLAIVKRIVDDHEGQIELETQTDVGTRFKITLPQPEALDDSLS